MKHSNSIDSCARPVWASTASPGSAPAHSGQRPSTVSTDWLPSATPRTLGRNRRRTPPLQAGHCGIVYQALGFDYLGRATPRTLDFLPDGTLLSARATAKVTGGERGHQGVIDRLVALGAPPLTLDQTPGEWLRQAKHMVGCAPSATQVTTATPSASAAPRRTDPDRHRDGRTVLPKAQSDAHPRRSGHACGRGIVTRLRRRHVRQRPNLAGRRPARVVFCNGCGVDSMIQPHLWCIKQATRAFELDELLVITAITGDEYPSRSMQPTLT